MKTPLACCAALCLLAGCISRPPTPTRTLVEPISPPASLPLVGRHAPSFAADAVMPDDEFGRITLAGRGSPSRYLLLVFYPGDFTFVCPTELLALNENFEEFDRRECDIRAVSVDSKYCHLAWRLATEDDGGIGPLKYPLIADVGKEISRAYGVLGSDGTVSLRAWFLVDRKGVVRHQMINDDSIGRSVEEALRVLDAVRFTDTHPGVCPAGWKPGDAPLEPSRTGVIDFLKRRP